MCVYVDDLLAGAQIGSVVDVFSEHLVDLCGGTSLPLVCGAASAEEWKMYVSDRSE